jgi:hypothetical protein
MKDQQPMSRVVVVSGKDRASITMAGHRGDGVFWYEDNFGFTTYLAAGEDAAAKLAPLAGLNVKIKAEMASPPLWTYSEESCRAFEADYQFGARTWHSKLPPENPSGATVRPVHLIDPYTVEAARILVDHFQLGRRGVTDLLAVSLSATDFVGHGYGTQGPEMCDHVYRLDAQIGAFLEEAFSLKDLLSHKVKRSAQSDYSLRDRYALSVMDGRSGDIIVAFKSGIATGPALPTAVLMGHSGPYRSDTAVPIVFWWQGLKGQTRILPVDTTMIAPTLANIIDTKPPADLDGTCFDLGFPGAPDCRR